MQEPARPKPVTADRPATNARDEHSRVGAVWISLIVFVVILLALLIFIAENSETVRIHFLGTIGKINFAVAMLLSAVAGIILTLLVGSLRIVQLKLAKRAESKPARDL